MGLDRFLAVLILFPFKVFFPPLYLLSFCVCLSMFLSFKSLLVWRSWLKLSLGCPLSPIFLSSLSYMLAELSTSSHLLFIVHKHKAF
ncbi:uncharacterized protein BDV17DRAFT_127664 [Aspergillus undulatus]|uniref:uncharacterized protein n=1 Tax=Aspergillus undulatus TaxID=1810928 RepID=UPI003CCCEA95